MNLEDVPNLPGPMCDYDYHLMPKAQAVLDYLKLQPTFRWWNRFFNRPQSLRKAGSERLDEYGYSIFLGWDSFACRNPSDHLTLEIHLEFRRVFGRPATLRD